VGIDQNLIKGVQSLEILLGKDLSFFLKNKRVVDKNLYLETKLNKLGALTL
jgi:hypothetical protein